MIALVDGDHPVFFDSLGTWLKIRISNFLLLIGLLTDKSWDKSAKFFKSIT